MGAQPATHSFEHPFEVETASARLFIQAFGQGFFGRSFCRNASLLPCDKGRLYIERERDARIKIPKSMDAAFMNPQTEEERGIKTRIDAFNAQQATKLEQEVFKQRKRRADAERSLEAKMTKKATDELRGYAVQVCRGLPRQNATMNGRSGS